MTNHKDISFFKLGLGLLVFLTFSAFSYAQNLTGPTTVDINTTETYIYNDGFAKPTHNWDITGGTLMSSSSSGTAYSAIIQWTTIGTGGINFKGKYGIILETLPITVQQGQGSNPPTVVTELNYVHNVTPRIATTSISSLGNTNKIEAISYFDGLGRTAQQVAIRAGGNSEDIITHIAYDEFGRNVKNYLPYSSTTGIGTYRVDALSATNTFYDASAYNDDFPGMTTADINPYSEKEFDNSPLNRVMKQAAPGKDWKLGNGHEIELDYLTNITNEVRFYSVSLTKTISYNVITYNPSLSMSGYYAVNELYKTITKDENHDGTSTKAHTTEEFKDKQGRVILKRTYGDSMVDGVMQTNIAHDTYYVYDDYGNLTFVLPPKAEPQTAKPDTTELSELCYQYKYDDLNRLVEKKIPGKGWEYIVYNRLDQPIMSQDQNLKAQNKWLFTKYDVFGRVVYTGFRTSSNPRITFQNMANGQSTFYETKTSTPTTIDGTLVYYNNVSFPATYITELHTINYYDNYSFDKVGGNSETAYGITPSASVKGLATGSKVKVLNTGKWITTVSYYDDKSRPIYMYSYNDYLGSTDRIKSQLTFDGRAEETTTIHEKTGNDKIVIIDRYKYDHANRLEYHTQKVNDAALDEVITYNVYDKLGQLVSKGVGGKENAKDRLQDVDFKYNIRGWLKTINDPKDLNKDLFAFKINYNTNDHGGQDLYNGNISETEWNTQNDNTLRWYRYDYDALNRITSGSASSNNYSLSTVAYDKNGNITTLKRNGHINANATAFDIMDDLTYYYANKSNKLMKVTDSATLDQFGFVDDAVNQANDISDDYSYDSNGNMVKDTNKAIQSPSLGNGITYNHLNLPVSVSINGNGNYGIINYIYDATGVKQKKIVSTGTNTEYAGNFIYENGELKFFSQPEGYVEPRGKYFGYTYQYKDHLGNIRLSYSDADNNGAVDSSEIIEEKNYYPFGLEHKGYNSNVSANVNSVASKFKYNGVEKEEALGLNLYEMPFRQYDPAIARWTSIDPVTHYSQSTYNGYDNNPVYWADPSGADVEQIEGGTRYTGADAQNMFAQLQAQYSNSNENNSSSDNTDPKNPFAKMQKEVSQTIAKAEKNGYLNTSIGNSQEIRGAKTYNFSNEAISKFAGFSRTMTIGGIIWGTIDLGYKNSTYITHGKEVKSIYTKAGKVRSARARGFAIRNGLINVGTKAFAGIGLLTDATGLYNYYNSTDPDAFVVEPVEAGLNTTMTGIGVYGGPPGWFVSGVYFIGQIFPTDYTPKGDNYSTPSGGGCFVAGTKITLSSGELKDIEKIKIGEIIKTYNVKTKKVENNEVLKIESPFNGSLIEILFANKTININTADHPYFVKDKGWSSYNPALTKEKYNLVVRQLEENDICYVLDKLNQIKEVKINKISLTDKREKTYNLSDVENNNNFFANGILVHNKLGQ